jgi:hypothetical protein
MSRLDESLTIKYFVWLIPVRSDLPSSEKSKTRAGTEMTNGTFEPETLFARKMRGFVGMSDSEPRQRCRVVQSRKRLTGTHFCRSIVTELSPSNESG